ncbi:hypothetical protein [Alicyclobacillus ferrooxydans]|uniref:Uncharacterized protein n=1 Tax=Alicyclobacillus ferrooxydans TaxID=471514 RepID=A0A0P9CK79_9BACL|nr:hypothetical protein [Alicyclobacillus ferrooxydans]KPV45703.1 hypothetical protein AN477_02025 [Alicyclobacillus ferrooxydans]
MDNNQQNRNRNVSKVALWGLPAIMFVCCGLPILLAAIGFTAAGAFLVGHQYWLLGGMILAMGIVMFVMSRRKRKSGKGGSCCSIPAKEK